MNTCITTAPIRSGTIRAAKFEHLEIGNIDGGHRAATFESKPLELIVIAHIEDEEFVAALQPFQQVSRSPYFIVQLFCHCGLRHWQHSASRPHATVLVQRVLGMRQYRVETISIASPQRT